MKEKGVSPVVGTILLIAITVALAAVVATLVGGLGGAGAPPNAMLRVTAEDNNDVDLTIEHVGGDDLVWADLSLKAGDESDNLSEITHGQTGSFSVGETVTIASTGISTTDDVITVFLIHDPSNQKIFSSTTVGVD
jgi:flagellin-like protein